MAHTHKLVDGVRIDLTAEEITALNTADTIENQRIIDTRIAETNAATKKINDKASANAKLKALGLTDDEIEALK
jgi:hypothetical protein